MGTTVRELAQQVQEKEGFPIVIMATQDYDLGDVHYEAGLPYDAYAGDLAARLSRLTGQKIVLYVVTVGGRLIYSDEPHQGSQDRLDFVRADWTPSGRLKSLLKEYGLKVEEQHKEDYFILCVEGSGQPNGLGDGNLGYGATFEYAADTGKFRQVWTGHC